MSIVKKLVVSALLLASLPTLAGTTQLLNASYDVSREFYKEYNPLFVNYWKQKNGEDVHINQSHGGSSKQAQSVHFKDGGLFDQIYKNK